MNFEDFVKQATEPGPAATMRSQRTAEEIMAEFKGIVDADRKRGVVDG